MKTIALALLKAMVVLGTIAMLAAIAVQPIIVLLWIAGPSLASLTIVLILLIVGARSAVLLRNYLRGRP
ncbi:MAG: hypothetical protein ACRC2H_03150 [Silanimonas sp.]